MTRSTDRGQVWLTVAVILFHLKILIIQFNRFGQVHLMCVSVVFVVKVTKPTLEVKMCWWDSKQQ